MSRKTPLVYMGSRTALICETYRHSEQKQSRKFCRSKEDKNGETHPVWAEKGETGCVLGAGEGSSGWRQMKPGEKTRCPNPNEHQTMQHMQKENLRKPSVFAGFLAGAEGLGLGCRLGRFAAERHWRSLTSRHAVLEWMWESAPGSGKRPMSSGSLRKSQRGRCWFGAVSSFWRRIVYRLPLLPSKEKHLRQEDGQAAQDHGRVGPGGI